MNGTCRRLFAGVLVAASLLFPLASIAAVTPDAVVHMARIGGSHLALQQVSAHESAAQDNSPVWAQWERARIRIYQLLGQRQAVIDRVSDLSSSAPVQLRAWALVQAAEAELAMGNGQAARHFLRQHMQLASAGNNSSARQQVGWLMIRSFVIDGQWEKALALMQARRQQQPDAVHERLNRLQARVWILLRKPAAAYTLLANTSDKRAKPLEWLAGLRAGKLKPDRVEKLIKAFLAAERSPSSRRDALIVAAEAALDSGHATNRIAMLEQALTITATAQDQQPPFALGGDDVWQALTGLGQVLGLQKGLAPDGGKAWLKLAAQIKNPVQRQAVLAVAALNSKDAAVSQTAHAQFAKLIVEREQGDRLLRKLYLHSNHFSTLSSVPKPVRYQLAAIAVDDHNMVLAARFFATLDQPPPDADVTSWTLTRARALILGGDVEAGITAIKTVLASGQSFVFNEIQPSLLALQSAGHHEAAIRFFKELMTRQPPPAARQKLLFWLGDSYMATEQYKHAAQCYLHSAITVSMVAMGQWATSARYKAAQALTKAGLIHDAHEVYQKLLNMSSSPDRRAVIRQKMTQLRLETD